LLAPPLPGRVVLGFDPGFANGCKLAVVDATGKLLATETIYPFNLRPPAAGCESSPRTRESEARAAFERLVRAHGVQLVAIGNGTGGRESSRFVRAVVGRTIEVAIVSEAGASVYSAS